MFKIFRGMFGQPKDLPKPFSGDALQYTFDYMKDAGESIQKISDDRFVWTPVDSKEIFFERTDEDLWVRSFYLLEDRDYAHLLKEFSQQTHFFSIVSNNQNQLSVNKLFTFRGVGDPSLIIDGTINQWKRSVLELPITKQTVYFRPYLNGKTFLTSTDAFTFYMTNIQNSKKLTNDHEAMTFDTGGISLTVHKEISSPAVYLSYGLTDLWHLKEDKEQEIIALIQKLAQRHPKTGFLLHDKGILLTHIFQVGAETDAMELFTVQLKVIHDAVLDYGNQLHFAPELEWAREDARKRGIYHEQD